MIKPKAIRKIEKDNFLTLYPEQYSLQSLKDKCKALGIKNTIDYRDKYREFNLPAHPERLFKDDWTSYRDFFDIPEFISYQELEKKVRQQKLKNANAYKTYALSLNDETIPLDPQTAYLESWKNWYVFLGKKEPFKPSFIPEEYKNWADKINDFMKIARGGGTKESLLCRFVRSYIIPFDKSTSPHQFLIQEKFDVKPFRDVIDKLKTESMKRKIVVTVNEFLDYIINNDLTIEDEDTGEIVRVANARNPFALLLTQQNFVPAAARSESTKPCLQYHFVKKAQSWIIPENAKFFRDLKQIQSFDADWIKVDKSLIDTKDKDCVYKIIDGQAYLWSPVDWIHTYTLTKVPLRGRQIAYNDSGEADKRIADLDSNGNIIWVANSSPFSGMTKEQSFLREMDDSQLGMYTTTNKTNNNGSGYTVPWIPEDLAYWLIKLRKWQQKFNPIAQPSSWIDCKRTNLNEIQRKAKGINCFLFRRFNDFEAAAINNALTPRLAATLYNIQPATLLLASLDGNAAMLSNYSSKYTPHSMRVSLITAYVIEMGMPIEVVMKIVGHSSVIMSIYYCKVSNQDIRKRLEEGEKIILKSESESIQRIIEQNKIEEVKNKLIGSNEEILNSLTNEVPAGNYIFRDYGICPYAASRCDDGGPQVQSRQFNLPVQQGYLGIQNCLQCRHFITGPSFLGGLLAITNEILLQSNEQSEICHRLQRKIALLEDETHQLDRKEYISRLTNKNFDCNKERSKLEVTLRNYESEYEVSAKKLDMLLCDIQSAYANITRCHNLINDSENDKDSLSLITMYESELIIEMEEVGHFQQLQEVCNNAIIYKSCNAETAIYPRTQILDKMAIFNEMMPALFTLSKEQQLVAGNQIYKLLMSRLKSWDKIQQVIDCKVRIDELPYSERVSKSEIELILSDTVKLIEA